MRLLAKRTRSLAWRNRKSVQRPAMTVTAKLKERKEGVQLTSLRRRNRTLLPDSLVINSYAAIKVLLLIISAWEGREVTDSQP